MWAPNFDTYNFDYDDGGRLTAVYYPNGVNQTLAWNADGSLKQVSHKNAATVLAQNVYGYDGLGRRNANQETLSGQATLAYTYQYDPLDRLTQVDNGTATQRQNYAYDALSNRVQKQLGNPVTATTTYKLDAANQLTEVRQTNLAGTLLEATLYDNNGNQSKKCSGATVTRASNTACTGTIVNQYGWNSFNKMAQITGASTASYQYDDQGRRTQKTEAATTTNYLYNGQSIYGEYPNADWTAPNALYVQAGTDHPLARITGSVASPSATAAYYHQDGLGSVLATTNAAKVVTATQRFDAFGTKLAGTGSIPQYGYTGREPDQSGLNYYRARYYDPNGGRITARDPMGYADGINRYAYVGNNPINFNDPNGLFAKAASNAITPSISYFTSGQFSQTAKDTVSAFGGAVQNNPSIGLTGAVPILAVPLAPQMLALGSVASGDVPLGVWSKNPFQRGQAIEKELGQNLPSNFPVIDKFQNGLATSIKSTDLNAASYQNTSTLNRTLTGYIDSVANYNGTGPQGWAGVVINQGQIMSRGLDLAIPNAGTAAQQQILNQAVQYGTSKGVQVNVIIKP